MLSDKIKITLPDTAEELDTIISTNKEQIQSLYNNIILTNEIKALVVDSKVIVAVTGSEEYRLFVNLKNSFGEFQLNIPFTSQENLRNFCLKYNIPSLL